MADIGNLIVKLSLEADKFKSGLDDAMSGLSKTQNSITSGFNALGGAVVAGAGVAVAGLTAFIADSTVEASKAADIQAQLASVLQSTGGASGMTADSVNSLAESLSKCMKFEDDTILTSSNLLLSFTSIGKDVFPMAQEAVLDMSQALGQDLKSSSIQLGKALNSPLEGLSSLSRVGVSFSEEQKKQIEGFMKVNDVASAQKVILGELAKEFGGSAKAAGQTLSGKLEILKNQFGNMKETIGGALLPVLSNLADTLTNKLNDPAVLDFITKFSQGLADFAVKAVGYLPQVIQGFQNVISFFQNNQGILIGILAVLTVAVVIFAVTSAAAFITAAIPLLPFIAAILGIIAVVALVYTAWTQNWGGIQQVTESVIGWCVNAWNVFTAQVSQIWNTFTNFFSPLVKAWQAAFQGDWRGFGENLRQYWDNCWNLIGAALTLWWNTTKTNFQTGINAIIGFFKNTDWGAVGKNIIEGIGNGLSSMLSWLIEKARDAAKAAYDAACGFLKINSPSRLFMGLGASMMEGMAMGVEEFTNLPVNATINASSATADSVTDVSSGAGGFGKGNFNITVTINGNATKQDVENGIYDGLLRAKRQWGLA